MHQIQLVVRSSVTRQGAALYMTDAGGQKNLCSAHPEALLCAQMRRLQQLNERHLRPIIAQLQEPKAQLLKRHIRRRDIDRLIRLKELMAPFVQDFSQTAHALRRQAFQVAPALVSCSHISCSIYY